MVVVNASAPTSATAMRFFVCVVFIVVCFLKLGRTPFEPADQALAWQARGPRGNYSSFGLAVSINQFGVIYLFRHVRVFAGQGDDDFVDLTGEREMILHLIVVGDRRSVINANIEGLAEREGSTHRFINGSLCHLLAVHVQLAGAFEH